MKKSKTKKLVFMALLTAISLGIWAAEAQIPPIVPIPGIKLGLANIVTLAAMALLGRKEAGNVLIARIVLGSLFAGSFSAILFSLAGGALAWGVMALTIGRFDMKKLWVVSVFGAVAHNAGELAAAVAVTKTVSLLWYGPILLASGIVTGAFTGVAAVYLVKATKPFAKDL
jgi:heptaprenyl diphosphate synthase